MERKNRGWLNIIGAIVVGYLAYTGQTQYSLYALALLFLHSGWYHVSSKKK